MYITVSVAISQDGYMNDISPESLQLSNKEDFHQIDILRSICDSIMVGAQTIRDDNPSLRIKSKDLLKAAQLTKITISDSMNLDFESKFFTQWDTKKIVITSSKSYKKELNKHTEIIELDAPITPENIIEALEERGIKHLMIEWGAQTLKPFLQSNLVDAMRVAVSPQILGEKWVAYLDVNGVRNGQLWLQKTETIWNMVVYHYAKDVDCFYLYESVKISRQCPRSDTAFSVWVIIITADWQEFSGYSRETWELNHAEEEALYKAISAWASLLGATMYSSLEPCSIRSSKPFSCSQIIIEHWFKKVVFGEYEWIEFVENCTGAEDMKLSGIEVLYIPIK